MKTSESIAEIADALAQAQAEVEGAVKGKINPAFRSKYADLGAVWDACREPLTKHGIAVVQPVEHVGNWLCRVCATPTSNGDSRSVVVTRLVHKSGQWMEDDGVPLIIGKQDMQGLGSALTYARRYGLMAMVGIAPEDDDGNKAVQGAPRVDAERTRGRVVDVKEETKQGKKSGQEFTKATVTLSTGEVVTTLDAGLRQTAKDCLEDGTEVEVTTKETRWGTDIVTMARLPLEGSDDAF